MNLCSNFAVLSVFLLSILSNTGTSASSNPCLGSCEIGVDGITKVCRFDFKVNLFAGELGYYQVDQCGNDPNPTLGIEKGVTYIFSQKDKTNYFHPLGFAYYPDGAHGA
mmetsp:Transcript_5457/g.10393  ORF Transcript_5457/g.10393 Transcript_5457/m.10393 type:complete len:109 (-) Transcript_5457:2544-2870(-)